MNIVVIGGTGLIGSKLVPKLRAQGHQIVPASPSSGVNTLTGEGLAEVIEGASVVVDVSNAANWEDAAVLEFFVTSIRNLLTPEAAVAGVGHHVALSVVGSDRMTKAATFARRIAQEELVRRDLAASNDPRHVVTDPPARYYGVEVSERTLILGDAQLSETRVVDWLTQTAGQIAATSG
jgi:uncharacterized protein YbjT (DUF2867 family)